jgi:DNA-binding HxlR family transcriptional regulator
MTDEELIQRFNGGEPIKAIAESIGKRRAYIDQRLWKLRRQGLVGRRREPTYPVDHAFRRKAQERRAAVKRLRLEDWTNPQIADELGVDPNYVGTIASELMAAGEIPRRREVS